MPTRPTRLAGALLAALLLAPALAGAAVAAEHTIIIEKMSFGSLPEDLKVGDTVVWQNKDIFAHTATARDESFDVDLPAGAEGRMELTAEGSFDFFCRYHPGMTGTLVVSP